MRGGGAAGRAGQWEHRRESEIERGRLQRDGNWERLGKGDRIFKISQVVICVHELAYIHHANNKYICTEFLHRLKKFVSSRNKYFSWRNPPWPKSSVRSKK
jgi:hypothetical protein